MLIQVSETIALDCQSFGREEDPTILLVMGAMNPGLFWPDTFCHALTSGGFRVVRYDQRDTGASTKLDYATNPYSLSDLADDAVGLADALDVDGFHVVGLSLGGGVGQILAANFPRRCLTLTVLASTIDSRPYNAATSGALEDTGALSLPDERLIRYADAMRHQPPTTPEETFEATIEGWRLFYGLRGFPETEVRARVIEAQLLQVGSTSAINHALAATVEANRKAFAQMIQQPTLIVHGTEDVAFGTDHARFSHACIEHSDLVLVDGMGHMPDDEEFLDVAQVILQHVSAFSDR